jgi:NADP-reducing hydrogenase subunit HndB
MSQIKSLEDLKRIREEALRKRELKSEPGHTQIIVGMGTPGIAAGARETMKAILEYIETRQLRDITVRQTGNIGLDSWEPIVQVVRDNEKISYGKVSPDVVQKIMKEHIEEGRPVEAYIIER